MLTDGKSTCYVGMTDVIVILFVSTDVVGRCFGHVDVIANNAILTDVMVTLCYCD